MTARTVDGTPDDANSGVPEPIVIGPGHESVIGNRFRILRSIEHFGMDRVQIAMDLSLGREVVLKRIKGAVEREALTRESLRLAQEGETLAQVSAHPNVVDLYDIVHDEALGETVLVLELIDGESLRVWQDKTKPWRKIVRMYLEAAKGLTEVHRKKLAHCDFKAENVVVSKQGIPHVIDFGIARAIEDARESAGKAARDPAGTVNHIAPERYRGFDPTPKSDQFSWAVALWEALSGQFPFRNAKGSKLQQAITEGPSGVVKPIWLRRILLRAMSDSEFERYPDMITLTHAIEAGLRRRTYAGLTAAVGGLLVVGTLFGWLTKQPPPEPEPEHCSDFEAKATILDSQLARLHGASGSSQNQRLVVGRVTAALDQWREDVHRHCDVESDVLVRTEEVDCMEPWLVDFGAGLELLINDGVLTTDMPEFLERLLPVGGNYCVTPPRLDAEVWRYAELARAYAHDGRLDLAHGYVSRAKLAADTAVGQYSAEMTEALDAHAQVLVRQGSEELLADAIKLMSQAQRHARAANYVSGQFSSLVRLAKLYTMLAEPDVQRAVDTLGEAEAVAYNLGVAERSLMWAELEDARGLVHRAAEKRQDAVEAHEAAVELFIELDRPVGTAKALANLGRTYWELKRYDEARSAYEGARSRLRSFGVPPTHDTLIRAQLGLGAVALMELSPRGIADLEHVLRHGPARRQVQALALLTSLLVNLGEFEQAMPRAKQCLEQIDGVDDHNQRFEWGLMCGFGLAYAGNPDGPEQIEALLRTNQDAPSYYDAARSWVLFLVESGHCAKAQAALEQLDVHPVAAGHGPSYQAWRAGQLEACE